MTELQERPSRPPPPPWVTKSLAGWTPGWGWKTNNQGRGSPYGKSLILTNFWHHIQSPRSQVSPRPLEHSSSSHLSTGLAFTSLIVGREEAQERVLGASHPGATCPAAHLDWRSVGSQLHPARQNAPYNGSGSGSQRVAAPFGCVVQSPATPSHQDSVLALVLIRHPTLGLWEGGALSSHSSFTSGSVRRKSQISASSTAVQA